ncbi:fumarylacetoacetate hydrolase family protein [Sphingomonas colocasiae]|uniref:Fumarylacetoacetate hydrolase family protein n=1 Tax=Sphingomonas colocasiae TaxID=1848973 RepID=A0ABS7PWM6_9SPHN|nr:fumarylacetoacetate hydrolase family protein [Sphingomonas colocasiae]MBY8825762.1 fumarylacetoacetate hydrolase family protein [Sphingomonas colocasiae]
MRLVTYLGGSVRRVGVVRNDRVFAIDASSMEDLLAEGEAGMARAARAAETGSGEALADVRLLAPVLRPRKFLGIAANYQSHIDEVKAANPDYVPPVHQRWFVKLPTSINGPYDPILLPPEGSELDWEVELAIVIGRRCRRVSADRAHEMVAGYTICNDVSVRDWQRRSPTIMLGKSFDSHGPLGPWIVTPDELGDPHALRLRCLVNGEVVQDGSTSEMLNSCWEQIAYLSTVCTLEPGDVLATGTPKGTGGSMKPPRFLKPGDRVRCEIDGIGAIEADVEKERVE